MPLCKHFAKGENSAFYKCFLSRRHFIVACNRLLTVLWGNNVLHFLARYFVQTWFLAIRMSCC